MTAAFLQSALTGLISDSKKRFNDVRTAAEKSLTDLKSISVTSETQLAADLSRRDDFIQPFVLACQTKQAKLALSGTACLQRLVASRAIPRHQLEDVVNAYWEAVDLSYEVQLKILQTLPALLQLYSDDLHGTLLARVLDVCASLQASRTTLVANSAGATLDQLVESILEQAEAAARSSRRKGSKNAETEDQPHDPPSSISDACSLFEDFCKLLNHGEPSFLTTDSLSPIYLLRALEKLLEAHGNFVRATESLVEACRTEVLPAIERLLRGKDDFLIIAHCTRLTYILLQKLSAHLIQDATPVLELYLNFSDRDGGPLWKRSLSLELFRNLLSNFGLLMRIFDPAQEKDDNVIASLMAVLVRIAAEDPTLIGMGRQSTMPAQRGADARDDEMASIEAQGIGGGGLASVSSADAGVTGVGLEFSTLERPLIDAEESAGPSSVPKTYIYTLILGSVSSLCEGLSKFVMPLSVTRQQSGPQIEGEDNDTEDDATEQIAQPKFRRGDLPGHKYQRLANPLKMANLPQLAQVQTCARMIDQCWPAILATSSTFLNAALDSHFYHVLIRSMQKLAQVSGTLELSTPRDALLTSLAKGSVPANAASIIALSQPVTHTEDDDAGGTGAVSLMSPDAEGRRQSLDIRKQSLNIRHLLCLRALLNLGIALGPTLGPEAWFIFIETLQQVEALMSISVLGGAEGLASPKPDGSRDTRTTLAGEMTAVTTASKRMFDSTRSYGEDTFTAVVSALFRLLGEAPAKGNGVPAGEHLKSPIVLDSPKVQTRGGHRATRSVSGMWVKTKALDVEVAFVLAKTKDLTRANLHRFVSQDDRVWTLVANRLLEVSQDQNISPKLRLEAAEILDLICMESIKILDEASPDITNLVQSKSLDMLRAQIEQGETAEPSRLQQLRIEIGQRVFEALEDILGHCGESLEQWATVFAILKAGEHHSTTAAAFRCVQLICNDFLQVLSPPMLASLISSTAYFAGQEDTNMVLTTASLVRNIATLLQERSEVLDIPAASDKQGPDLLWFSTIQQLARLCLDPRRDVRDASVRILIQAVDTSGDLLSSISWRPVLQETSISLVHHYLEHMQEEDSELWETTCIYLTEATTKLINDHIASLVLDPTFSETWRGILGMFEAELEQPTFRLYTTAFRSIGVLLQAVSALKVNHSPLVSETLVLWARYKPPISDDHPEASKPNQEALAAHASILNFANTTGPAALESFEHEGEDIAALMQSSIQDSILSCRHPPYSNDIRKLSTEQEISLRNIGILQDTIQGALSGFVNFLLGLLESMHVEVPKPMTASKNWQKPTFTAFSASLLTLLRQMLEGDPSSVAHFDCPRAIHLLSAIIALKYTKVPTNSDAPLWKDATKTAAVLLETLKPRSSVDDAKKVAEETITISTSVLGAGGLSTANSTQPSPESLSADEDFDIAHFTRIHAASNPLLCLSSIDEDIRKRYILAIFHASILADPWFDDFPDDVAGNSLKDINTLRRGSVHSPVFSRRQKIVYAALDALFDLVNPEALTYNAMLAKTSFPYLLLRIAHPIKVFLADQPLRGLTPLPKPQQVELYTVLRKCLELRCDDGAFEMAMAETRGEGGGEEASGRGEIKRSHSDGKSHLRALYKMVLRLQKGWKGTMRLKDGMAWQDEEEGRGVEEAMEMWVEAVAEGWDV